MLNKWIILISTLIILIVITQPSSSVPAPPSPYCEITAKVLSVEKKRINFQNIPWGYSIGYFDYYGVKLDILEITMYKQEGDGSCDESYAERAENARWLIVSKDDDVSADQKIRAIIHYGGDESFGGFFVSDINILSDERVNDTIEDKIAQKGNTTDKNMTVGREGRIKDIGSWYYIAPIIIILFIALYILMGRKRE